MTPKKIIQIILLILICCVFYIIFNFSNQQAEESEGLSRNITSDIVNIFYDTKQLEQSQVQEIVATTDRIVRKLAHFSLYTITGMILMLLLNTTNLKKKNKIYISLILGILYAISDEMHQIFVPGRTPLITDVLIDTLGIIFGISIIIIVIKIYNKIKKNLQKLLHKNI